MSFAERHWRWLAAPAVIAFLALVAYALLWLPEKNARPIRDPHDRINTANDLRQTYAYIVAGMVGAVVVSSGAFFTYRGWRTSHEGQITERFTRAIDQLGSDKLEVRLGGIYALERIARDSAVDHGPVFEVLTAFVRQRWPASGTEDMAEGHKPDTDLQAVLTVTARRRTRFPIGEDQSLDLTESDLRGVDLMDAQLAGVSFASSNLDSAKLLLAHLEKANFYDASLRGAILTGANLEQAHLLLAHLDFAELQLAHLEGAVLVQAHFDHADLRGAHLAGANLSNAYLYSANLSEATGLTHDALRSSFTNVETRLPDYLVE